MGEGQEMSSELPSIQPALGHLGMKTVVLSGQQVPWYKGKTASLPGQRRNQSPHCCSVPLESSGMDLPARKPAHPCSWACLPPRGTQATRAPVRLWPQHS
ncbi:unnamed protein product [Rangifer tarandus platyrhynchus]|uniref:Uncharacterized protein n=2 Tax=Rangifer tarandus platyrhynchus TaxID=3082113 RepID=A0AC59Z145_RANTA|nr:unnamed protein product [Rangifer tarandus platyrhynchus]